MPSTPFYNSASRLNFLTMFALFICWDTKNYASSLMLIIMMMVNGQEKSFYLFYTIVEC